MELNAVSFSKSPNEYYQKFISNSGLKMDLYPALRLVVNRPILNFFNAYLLLTNLFNFALNRLTVLGPVHTYDFF